MMLIKGEGELRPTEEPVGSRKDIRHRRGGGNFNRFNAPGDVAPRDWNVIAAF
jgi:hypothetical protein